MPIPEDQPVLVLLDRTLANLDHIECVARREHLLEATQLIASFATVFGTPWDRLLDKDTLKKISIHSPTFSRHQFPKLQLRTKSESQEISLPNKPLDNAYQYLGFMRNAMAHGNYDLLDWDKLNELRADGPFKLTLEFDIAGLLLWNIPPNNNSMPDRETTLTLDELRQALFAMRSLCSDRGLWKEEVKERIREKQRNRWVS